MDTRSSISRTEMSAWLLRTSKNFAEGMRANTQSVRATMEAERGSRSTAENSPKMSPADISVKITSRPASV